MSAFQGGDFFVCEQGRASYVNESTGRTSVKIPL